jgi:hypothetical protein
VSLASQLQTYYKWNDNGLDSSGKGRTLTYFGTEAYATGKFDEGYSLTDNNADYAEGSNSTDLDFAGAGAEYTISLWINLNTNGSQVLVEKVNASLSNGWTLYRDAIDGISFQFAAAAGMSTPGSIFGTGAFHHVVVRSNGTTVKIFIDGSEEASTSTPNILTSSEPLLIGHRISSNAPLDGIMDELAIWDRGLSDAEIAQLYNSGAGFQIPLGSGTKVKQLDINEPLRLMPYTVATLPDATLYLDGDYIFVTDETGGSIPAFSDGTNWRRSTDRAVVS